MANNFVQKGKYLPLTAPSGGVVSGGIYKINALAVVAMTDALEGETFEGATEEVWELPKLAADVLSEGEVAKLKSGKIDKSGTVTVGVVTEAAGNGDAVCKVRLVQSLA